MTTPSDLDLRENIFSTDHCQKTLVSTTEDKDAGVSVYAYVVVYGNEFTGFIGCVEIETTPFIGNADSAEWYDTIHSSPILVAQEDAHADALVVAIQQATKDGWKLEPPF